MDLWQVDLSANEDQVTIVTGDAGGFVNSTTVSAKGFTVPDTDGQAIQDAWTFECAMNLSAVSACARS